MEIKAVLGAPDPEMELVEQLLRECRAEVIYAQAGGRRVHVGNAYQADNIPVDATLVIECGPAPESATVIDHHKPGDPGYGRPASEYLPASSLGQVLRYLSTQRCSDIRCTAPAIIAVTYAYACGDGDERYGFVPRCFAHRGAASWYLLHPNGRDYLPCTFQLAAASDHCLAAAYRGECPGVDPEELMRWRAQSRATFQRRSVEEVLADVERARKALRNAPLVALGPDICVRDLRGQHIAELPEAAARDGICFIADLRDKDGRTKIVCQSGSPEQIRAFMEWGKEGLTGIYGDPARGFAGGYLVAE